jgi:hypothetical protein
MEDMERVIFTNNIYPIGAGQSSNTIDFSNYISGTYSALLICNGAIVDVKQIVKQ